MKRLILLGILVAVAYGAHRHLAERAAEEARALVAGVQAAPPPRARTDLPRLVEDFARAGGAAPGALAPFAELVQEAELRLSQGGRWNAITARQVIAAGDARFAWLAEMRLGPVSVAKVVDAYAEGEGQLSAHVFGSVPVADERGGEIAAGEAMRYLAELPWFPDAILGNPALVWRLIGPREASVAMALPGGPVSVVFVFDMAGDIAEMRAEGRPAKDDDGTLVLREWRGYFRDYRRIGGRRIPAEGEVGYVYDSGYEAYWKGRITGYSLGG